MYPLSVRRAALAGLTAGEPVSSVGRRLGVSRSTVRIWRADGLQAAQPECPSCDAVGLDSMAGTRYDYPRWQFSNRSEDIHGLCQSALDLVGVDWKRSSRWTTSVSTRDAVSRLDRFIGLKS